MSFEHPNYYNIQDRTLFHELEKVIGEREFTPQEDYFFKAMYHMEEVDAGLDGDL